MNARPEFPRPRATEAEQALLGAAMHDAAAFDVASEYIREADLDESVHRRIWRAMDQLRGEGRDLKPHLIIGALGIPAEEPIGIADMTAGQYIARLAAEAVSINSAPDFAKAVRDAAHGRRLASLTWDAMEAIRSGNLDIPELATQLVSGADAIMQARQRFATPRVTIGEAAADALEAMRRAAQGEKPDMVTTGLNKLDDLLGGGYPVGELTIEAARPSMGKTALGVHSAVSGAMSGGAELFFSLEMKADALGQRAISMLVYGDGRGPPVPYLDIRRGSVPPAFDGRLADAWAALDRIPLVIEQQGGLTMGQIATRARQVKDRLERKGIRLRKVTIDHIGLVTPSDRYAGARHRELAEITTAAKNLAKDLDVAVVGLCQLNRGVEGRENKRPGLADLRESGSIEENADSVLFLYRPAYYLERRKEDDIEAEQNRLAELTRLQNVLEINVAKQRQGPTRTIEVFVDIASNAIRDAAGARRV